MQNRMPNIAVLISFCLVMVGIIVAEPTEAATQTINLKYGTYWPPNHFFTIADKNVVKKIEAETNGKVKFEFFAGGTLTSRKESLTELKMGVVDMGYVNTDYAPGFQVLKTQRSFYYGAPDVETARKIYMEVLKNYPQLESEFEGVKIMARVTMPQPIHILTARKPVRTIADLKGMKLKAAAPMVPALRALGAEGLTIPITETYSALEKGILDGCLLPLDVFKSFKLHEVIKYVTRLDYYMGPYPSRAFNLDTYKKLSPDVQKVIGNTVAFWGLEHDRLGTEAIEQGIEMAKAKDVQFIEFAPGELDKFYDALSVEAMKEAEKLDAKGLPGTKVYQEVRRLIKNYQQ